MRVNSWRLVSATALLLAFTLSHAAPPARAQAPAAPQAPEASSPPVLGAPKPFPFPFTFPRAPVAELRARREALAAAVGDGAVILVSHEPPTLSSGARYKPDHDVFYFTGVDTDFCGFVQVCREGKVAETKLFLPAYDRSYETWNGRRVVAGDEAKALTGIDDVVSVRSGIMARSLRPLEEEVRRLAAGSAPLYLPSTRARGAGATPSLDLTPVSRADRLAEFVRAANPEAQIKSLGGVVTGIRGVKSPFEIGLVREAVRASGEGFVRALRQARPGMWEFEFQAHMEHAFIERGCTGLPYFPIAASGPNANVLHYTENRRRFEDGDLVLCDIAAEYGYYAADITRTFPANGKFTPRQRLVYEAVLAGQTAAAAALKPEATLNELDSACRAAMKAAGLKGNELYPHGLGHHVGLDVHDVGAMHFVAGMIITIEPGSYLKSESLGVRIEDCFLVTESGCECLSAAIPRTVEDLEAIVGAGVRDGR